MAFLGYGQTPTSAVSILGDVLQGLAERKAQDYKINQNKQFLQSLGIRPDVAQGLARQPDDFIQKFLGQYEGFEIGNPQQPQFNMQGLQQPNQQNQLQPDQLMQQNQPQVNQLMQPRQPQNRNMSQLSPEQAGQLLQNQAYQEALHPNVNQQPTGIRSKVKGTTYDQDLKKEKFEQQKQDTINKKYAKQIEQFEKDYINGSQVSIIADELLKLNEEIGENWNPAKESATSAIHKLSFGLIDPRSTVGTAGEQFRTKSNEVINTLSNAIRGLPSKYRVSILEASKPSLNQTYEARKRNILDLKKKGEALQIPYAETLKILESNNGNIPDQFSRLVLPDIKQKQEFILNSDNENNNEIDSEKISKLPNNPTKWAQENSGEGWKDEKTGKIYIVKNGKWVVYKG